MRRLQTRRAVFVLIVLAAAASWVPAALAPADQFWVGISSNLFASAITVLGTVFVIERLLEAGQRRSPSSAAVRESIRVNVSQVLTGLYSMETTAFDASISGLADLRAARWVEGVDQLPPALAQAWATRDGAFVGILNGLPLEALIRMADAVLAKAEAFRLIIAISRNAVPESAVVALLSAVSAFEVVKAWTLEARIAMAGHDANSEARRLMCRPLLAALLSDAVEKLCVGYNAINVEP